jgi:hypothetical protein
MGYPPGSLFPSTFSQTESFPPAFPSQPIPYSHFWFAAHSLFQTVSTFHSGPPSNFRLSCSLFQFLLPGKQALSDLLYIYIDYS